MGKVRIELNSPGIRALLRSPEMQAVLKDRADTVKDRCGDGYESYVAPTRAVAVVETISQKALFRCGKTILDNLITISLHFTFQ